MTMITVLPLVFFQNVLKLPKSSLHIKRTIYRKNCRPISILSNISQIYERLMQDNMSDYFNDVLSKL